MKEINVTIPVTTGADLFYIPVPCRGVIAAGYAVHNQETNKDEVITLNRDDTAVMTFTPTADSTTEGVMVAGVQDTTNGQLVFDPESDTGEYQVIEISIPATFDTAGQLGLFLLYDDSAYVEQTPSEA